ncbi:hypothetical protein C2W62_50970 [Candidatus Entotheonella serta]|nr:hypothetical protein C2W62_50970 [Candidatus Entotheonella serta]
MHLPTQGAFVVQFATDTDLEANRLAGRVEHVVSHQAARFESWPDLRRVLIHMLQQVSDFGGEDGGCSFPHQVPRAGS